MGVRVTPDKESLDLYLSPHNDVRMVLQSSDKHSPLSLTFVAVMSSARNERLAAEHVFVTPEAGIARRIEDIFRHETNVSRRNASSSRRKPALRAGLKTCSATRPTSHAGTRLRHAGSRHCAPDRRRLPSRDQHLMPEHVSARPQGALSPFTREKIFFGA